MLRHLEFELTSIDATLPTRSHELDSGLDFYSPAEFTLQPGQSVKVKLGVKVKLPKIKIPLLGSLLTVDMFMQPRSSLNSAGVFLGGGVIDNGYRGELIVNLWNFSVAPVHIVKGDRICQGICRIIWVPKPLHVRSISTKTSRGSGAFGSTGK